MANSTVQRLMAYSLATLYVWFGLLKFFSGMSPAEELVTATVNSLFFGIIPDSVSIYMVAALEVLLGIVLFLGWQRRRAALVVLVHMAFTCTPLFLFPELCFDHFPAFTLVGQYILKNLVLAVGALMLLQKT